MGLEDHPNVPTPPDRVPTLEATHGAFERGEQIGAGGDADVYLATVEYQGRQRRVALKEPRFEGTISTPIVKRFAEEAETWAKLDEHPSIVTVLDWDSEPLPWIAMEYMEYGSLETHLEDGPLPLAAALWLGGRIADALKHGHRHGVAHLDVKPANVLLADTGEGTWPWPKVSDWGLARLLLEDTQSMEGLSPHYAAPEQFDPESYGSPNDRTDVYQLGAVLYELVTGEPAYSGSAAAVMRAAMNESPTPPSEVADVPAELDDVILTALATEQDDRHESVLYVRDALEELFAAVTGYGDSAVGPTSGGAAGSALGGRDADRDRQSTGTNTRSPDSDRRSTGRERTSGGSTDGTDRADRATGGRASTGTSSEAATATGTADSDDGDEADTSEPADDGGTRTRRWLLRSVLGVGVLGGSASAGFLAVQNLNSEDSAPAGSGGNGGDGGTNNIGGALTDSTPTATRDQDGTPTLATGGSDEPVKIGALLPLSGPWKDLFPKLSDALEFARSDIAAGGGPLGREIDLQVVDTESDVNVSVNRFQQLAFEDDVAAVIGPFLGAAPRIADRAVEAEVMAVSAGSQVPEYTSAGTANGHKYAARTSANGAQGGIAAGHALRMADGADAEEAVILTVDTQYWQEQTEQCVSTFEDRGGTIRDVIPFPYSIEDPSSVVAEAFDRNPDAVCYFGPSRVAKRFLQHWRDQDLGGRWVLTAVSPIDNYTGELADLARNQYVVAPAPASTATMDRFRAEFGDTGTPTTGQAYDALQLVALAVEAAGEASGSAIARTIQTVSGGEGTAVSGAQFERARRLLAGEEPIDYQGASGPVDLTDRLEPIVRFSVDRITDDGGRESRVTLGQQFFESLY